MSSPDSTPSAYSVCSSPNIESPASSISDAPSLSPIDVSYLHSKLGPKNLPAILESLVSIAYDAGKMMLAADPSIDDSDTKRNTSDRVTATDKAIEDMVQARLAQDYPDFQFLGEETFKHGQKLGDEPTFVCDPIDGTLNFIHGFPNTAISLALTVAKRPVVGVVYNPFRGDLFTAIKGRGAFLTKANGSRTSLPIRRKPAPMESLNDCLVAIEWGNQREGSNWELRTSVFKKLLSSQATGGAMAHSVRSNGSAALDFCYVAAGTLDVFWEGGCWIWDVCAGWLIVEEAGGIVAGANPGEWDPTLEGRSYMPVRAGLGQHEVVEEMWSLMDGKKFDF